MKQLNNKNGFTLIELLISMGIIIIIAAAVSLNMVGYQQTVSLDSAAKDIKGALRSAQSKAIVGEDGDQDQQRDNWGVKFSNAANDKYEIFYGTAYNPASTTETIYLPASVVFTDPADLTSKEIIFTAITGTTTSSQIEIQNTSGSASTTITIDASGKINSN